LTVSILKQGSNWDIGFVRTGWLRSPRRIRFTSVEDVARLTDPAKAYVDEAIDVEEVGWRWA